MNEKEIEEIITLIQKTIKPTGQTRTIRQTIEWLIESGYVKGEK